MIILEELQTPFGKIRVTRSKEDGSCTYEQEDCLHSIINSEGVSTCGYVHAIHSIIQQSGLRRILMIGCAGGTLATMLHRVKCEVTVVDMNPVSFTLARQYFAMPPEIECVVEEGSAYIHRNTRRYEAIIIDAFDNDGNIPAQLSSEEFFVQVRETLTPQGIVLMNIITLHDLDKRARQYAINMKNAGLPAVLFDKQGIQNRNTVVAGRIADHVRLPSGREPAFIREELRRMQRVKPLA